MIPSRVIETVRIRVTMHKNQEPYVARSLGLTASSTMSREMAATHVAAKAFSDLLGFFVAAEDVVIREETHSLETKPEYVWWFAMKEDA